MAHEGDMSRNKYTFPMIPLAHASDLKSKWVKAGKSSIDNPIEKIGLAVQRLGAAMHHPLLSYAQQ